MSSTSSPVSSLSLDALELLEHSAVCVKLSAAQGKAAVHLYIEASAPGVYRLRCGTEAALAAQLSAQAQMRANSLLARAEAVGEFELAPLSEERSGASGWRLTQGESCLDVYARPFALRLYRKEKLLLCTAPQAALCHVQAATPHWQLQWTLDNDDGLYGLGQTTADLDRRGQRLDSDEQPLLPFLWGTRGWGLYANTWGVVQHDLGHDVHDRYRLSVQDALLDVFLFAGEPVEILNQYTALTGRAGQPVLWPMGVWLDQASGTGTATVLQAASSLRRDHFAFDAVQLAEPACYGFQPDKPVLEWDAARTRDVAPDASAMLAKFADLNVQLAASTLPVVLAGTPLCEEWEDRGWLLCREDGQALILDGDERTGGKSFALLDLTHKDVYRLWSERQRQMMEDGLGAPVCNARFAIPDDVIARSGESAALLRARYPALVRQALFDAVAGHKTPQEGVLLSRDLFPGVQRYAWQLGPCLKDQQGNDWAGFEQSLRAALAVGHAGVALQTHRLGNADAPAHSMTPELYLRWLAACVFSGNFSFQATPALLPQAFDDATQALVRHWLAWRYRLIPYVLGIVEDAVRTGLPVQRSMALCYPDDPMAQAWDTQYLLGPALLVAPVLQPGTEQRVYLPRGDAWWDLSTGNHYAGGTTLTMTVGLDSLPVFGREGHMLCLGPATQHTGEFNTARLLEEVWMFGMPEHSPVVMRNKIRVMQMQGSSYIKGLEGLRILPSEGLEVKRRGAEVRISRVR